MKNILIYTILAASVCLSACDDWTTPESLEYPAPKPDREAADPVGFRKYLDNLAKYKKSNHKVIIATMDGAGPLAGQYQRLVSMPDSLDYVCVKNILSAPDILKSDIKAVSTKATKVLCVVDYKTIDEGWQAIWASSHPEEEPDTRSAAEFAAYCKTQTEEMLACTGKFGFHGIAVSYQGNTGSETGRAGQEAFMGAVKVWRNANPTAPMIFKGFWSNLADTSILDGCAYIVAAPADNVRPGASADATTNVMNNYITGRFVAGMPKDRMVYEVVLQRPEDISAVGVSLDDAAKWLTTPQPPGTTASNRFTKAGIAVDNAQADYFGPNNNSKNTYSKLRKAIGVASNYHEEVPI